MDLRSLQISGRLLARNTGLNLIGQVVPLIIGVATIPFVIRGLGTDRFGLLSIAWVVLGYFAVFDLGLGRATTKFVSEALGRGEQEQVPRIVWSAVTAETILGLMGALILAIFTPALVGRVLNIPQEMMNEAKSTFYILAVSVPIVLASGSFRGVLSAAQRFDLVNTVKIPVSSATYILPLIGIVYGLNMPGIVALILLARIGGLAVYIRLNFRIIPGLRRYSGSMAYLPRLISFGGWATITSIVSPILVYFERFMIGSMLSLTALAFYSAPSEMVNRLTILPASLAMTIFPAFSTLGSVQDRERSGVLFTRAVKYVMLVIWPTVLIVVLFAGDILRIWLGADFAKESASVLQLLAIGVLLNSLAHVPFSLLQGIGRPDIPAKFHLVEMPIFIGTAWILIKEFGITGAALAWTMRMGLDALFLFIAASKNIQTRVRTTNNRGILGVVIALCALTIVAHVIRELTGSFSIMAQAIIITVLIFLFGLFVWKRMLDAIDKSLVIEQFKSFKRTRESLNY